MAVYKRDNSKYYWLKFMHDGKIIRRSTKTANIRKAQKFERELLSGLERGRIGIDDLNKKKAKAPLFADEIANFLDRCRSEKKASTAARYETSSKSLSAFFGRMRIDEITEKHVEKFKTWRKNQKRKPPGRLQKTRSGSKTARPIKTATLNRDLAVLRYFFNELVKSKEIHLSPVPKAKLMNKERDRIEYRVLTKAEWNAYIMAASQPLRDVASVMYATGMRPSEVFALTADDIDFRNSTIFIKQGKTASARRRLTFPDSIESILTARCDATVTGLLFGGGRKGQDKGCGESTLPLSTVKKGHKAAVARSGVKPFRLYDLRHTFATDFLQSGGDLLTLAAVLGHTDLAMVNRYAHPTEPHQALSVRRLEEYRNGGNVKEFRRAG